MALFAAAWVLPSVLGPVLTGYVTEAVGWRWVFAAGSVVLVPVWLGLVLAVSLAALALAARVCDVDGLQWAAVSRVPISMLVTPSGHSQRAEASDGPTDAPSVRR
ncbi:hypothetical protein LQK93_00976 [Terrabacter sp. BE26]